MTILIWYGITSVLCVFCFVLGAVIGRGSMLDGDE